MAARGLGRSADSQRTAHWHRYAYVSLLVLVGCAEADVPINPPADVVQAVFDAASAGSYRDLSGLCDPRGDNDSYTQQICDAAANEDCREEFVSYFSRGHVSGPVSWSEDRTIARVPVSISPGDPSFIQRLIPKLRTRYRREVQLIRRDTTWYLYRIEVVSDS